jgi:hypothetical protein
MCTTVVSFDPSSATPVLIASLRDEFVSRGWHTPGRNWRHLPGLVGPRDILKGGTWLATAPHKPRVACILNGPRRSTSNSPRRTRGILPLQVASTGGLDDMCLSSFDPFHLVVAEPDSVKLLSWDGVCLTSLSLLPGMHMIVNRGLVGPSNEAMSQTPRARRFYPLFEKAIRPVPRSGMSVGQAWGDWLYLVNGGDLDAGDSHALVRTYEKEGRVRGTTSSSLIALGVRPSGAPRVCRYDHTDSPGDPQGWHSMLSK